MLKEVQPRFVNDIVDHLAEINPIIFSVANPFDVTPVNGGGIAYNAGNTQNVSANASEMAEVVSVSQRPPWSFVTNTHEDAACFALLPLRRSRPALL